jgi:hypothetical protein
MSKKRKLVKDALKHPEMFAPAELSFFDLWLRARKERKAAKKRRSQLELAETKLKLEREFLI